jgi:hypothetical protein
MRPFECSVPNTFTNLAHHLHSISLNNYIFKNCRMRCYFTATVDTSYCITSNFTITVKSQQLLRESKNCLMENDSLMAGCYEHRNTPDEPSPHPHIKFKTHFNIILQSTPRFSFTVCEKKKKSTCIFLLLPSSFKHFNYP